MLKRSLLLALSLMVALSLLAACAPKEGAAGKATPVKSEKIVMKASSAWKRDHMMTGWLLGLIDTINKGSGGRIEIQFLGGPEVVAAADLMTALGKGNVDLTMSAANYYSGIVPENAIIGLPVTAWDFGVLLKKARAVTPDLDKIWQERLGVKYLGIGIYGPWYICTSKKAVRTVEDVKGLKVQSIGSYADPVIAAFGAAPVRTASAERYDAVQRGVVDGALQVPWCIRDWGESDIYKYITMWSILNGGCDYYMRLETWKKLSPDLQQLIEKSTAELQERAISEYTRVDGGAEQFLKQQGVELIYLSSDEAKRWQKVMSDVVTPWFMEKTKGAGGALIEKIK